MSRVWNFERESIVMMSRSLCFCFCVYGCASRDTQRLAGSGARFHHPVWKLARNTYPREVGVSYYDGQQLNGNSLKKRTCRPAHQMTGQIKKATRSDEMAWREGASGGQNPLDINWFLLSTISENYSGIRPVNGRLRKSIDFLTEIY